MEDWVTIKNLKKKQPDKSLRAIAKELGISHNTVKSALGKEGVPVYRRSGVSQMELENFRDVIVEMLSVKKFRGSRIFNELKSKGYKGGQTALYVFLRQIRPTEEKHFMPYETGPAEQAQFDWSPYTVFISGNLTQIYIYSYVNSFSRYPILEASLSQNQAAILEALENSIIESEGPCQRLQTDNAKAFVISASKNNFKWNPRYLNFCAHYGFMPTRSLPGHPWSKGKVEKPFSYLETHFIAGSSFEDFPDMQKKLKLFQKEMNLRLHSVTKARPRDLFEQEKPQLLLLPETRYVGIKEDNRKASFDCLLSYNGSRYSVPWMFAGKWVWIRESKGYYLNVYSEANKLIATHTITSKKGSIIINKDHYRSQRTMPGGFEALKAKFLESFPSHEMFVEKLRAQKRINTTNHLHQILSLSKLYTREDFLEAVGKSLEYNVFSYAFISGYLEKNHKQSFRIEPVDVRAELPKENVKRDMSQYNMF
jgi:transposase